MCYTKRFIDTVYMVLSIMQSTILCKSTKTRERILTVKPAHAHIINRNDLSTHTH